jgi:ribA/ribD-fused uncharacterized protein
LRHLTEDKMNSRGAGRREVRTHQPTGGRANEGGLRIGEMERDSLCSHGIAAFLQESMMKRGDATDFWICNGCGRIPIYNESEGLFVCPTCDGPLTYTGLTADTLTMQLPTKQSRVTFTRIAMPYTLKLVDQEMTTLGNMGMRFITEGAVSALRDEGWDWQETEIAFTKGERGVEAESVNPEALAAAEESAAAGAETEKVERVALRQAKKGTVVATVATSVDASVGVAPIRFGARLENEFIGFSNFASTPFRVDGAQFPAPDGTTYPEFGLAADGSVNPGHQTWPTVEHYYQAMKFPQDPVWQEEIRMAGSPARAKKMGLSNEHPVRGDWEAVRDRVMKKTLRAKFMQNPGLLARLQKTGDRRLEEASPGDLYWGTGVRGNGRNRMGELLSELRTELKDVRVDQEVLGIPAAEVVPAAEDEDVVDAAANLVGSAEGAVAAATGGVVQVAKLEEVGEEGAGEPAEEGEVVPVEQKGGSVEESVKVIKEEKPAGQGVYLFINPQIGASDSRVGRPRGSGRRLQWEGMSGGGSTEQYSREAADEGGSKEIVVQKEE